MKINYIVHYFLSFSLCILSISGLIKKSYKKIHIEKNAPHYKRSVYFKFISRSDRSDYYRDTGRTDYSEQTAEDWDWDSDKEPAED